ncbi:Z1 domain-containing protein [Azotobacter chroococcum]
MYDTLMQMGRWFGYRPGYVDLCRLYTTPDLVEWFGHIADAAEELRQEFDTMVATRATPREYGMKVQSHPVLMVTSPLKMRSAKSLQLSFSGEVLETVAFHRDPGILAKNLAAAEHLFEAAGVPAEAGTITRKRDEGAQDWKGFLWKDVPADHVIDFFGAYLTHPAARKVNSALLMDFIKAMVTNGELTSWTVVLMGGGEENPTLSVVSIRSTIWLRESPRMEAGTIQSEGFFRLETSRSTWVRMPGGPRWNLRFRHGPRILPGRPMRLARSSRRLPAGRQ